MNPRYSLSRRTVLRGLGLTLALPTLEAMLNTHGTAYAQGGALPKRFGVFFWGNGIDPVRWIPSSTGQRYTLSSSLSGLSNVKEYVSVVTGAKLTHIRGNAHLNCAQGILTGDDHLANTNDNTSDYRIATVKRPSIDQVIAAYVRGTTPYPSIQITSTPEHPGGTGIGYISHSGPYSANKGERDPRALFNRLFGASFAAPGSTPVLNPRNDLRRSILDGVRADAERLSTRLGKADRDRLDEHLTGVRSLEQRIARLPPVVVNPVCKKPLTPGSAADMRTHTRLMSDILAMAFACDLTRVVAYQFTSPASHVRYPDVGYQGDIHEDSHVQGLTDPIHNVFKFIIEQFGTVLTALKSQAEGNGNVLDNSVFFATSCIGYGPSHDPSNFPLLIAGRGGGTLKHPGAHVALEGANATRVPFTCLKAMGLPDNQWGVGPHATSQAVSELLT